MLEYTKLKSTDKPINEYLSCKLTIISFVSALAVILIHCYNSSLEPGTWSRRIEDFFSQALCRSAVPFFFACSGYLLYATLSEVNLKNLLQKLKKRFKTLFLPWFLWICIYIVFFWVLYRFLSVWNKQTYLCDWQKSSTPVLFILKEYLWGDCIIHLWFLKRLMLFQVCSPVLIYLLKKLHVYFLIFVSLLVFSIENSALDPRTSYFNDDLLGFVLGLSCAVCRIDMRRAFAWYVGCIALALWLVLCILPLPVFQLVYLRNLAGVIALWTFYDTIYPYIKRFEKQLLSCARFSFVIYCFHMISLSVFAIILTPRMPHELMRYFGVWISAVIGSIVFCWGIKKFIPRGYNVLGGGR